MKQIIHKLLAVAIAVALLTPLAVSAHDGQEHQSEPSHDDSAMTHESLEHTSGESRREDSRQRSATTTKATTEAKQKLDDTKRKVCDARQSRVNTVMDNMDDRRQRVYDHITKVFQAVKKFHGSKQLNVSDYAALVAKVDAAQAAALSAKDAQQSVPAFDCSGDRPRADIVTFKTSRQASIAAMQTYRQSVKDLIKAVKAVAAQQEKGES